MINRTLYVLLLAIVLALNTCMNAIIAFNLVDIRSAILTEMQFEKDWQVQGKIHNLIHAIQGHEAQTGGDQ